MVVFFLLDKTHIWLSLCHSCVSFYPCSNLLIFPHRLVPISTCGIFIFMFSTMAADFVWCLVVFREMTISLTTIASITATFSLSLYEANWKRYYQPFPIFVPKSGSLTVHTQWHHLSSFLGPVLKMKWMNRKDELCLILKILKVLLKDVCF